MASNYYHIWIKKGYSQVIKKKKAERKKRIKAFIFSLFLPGFGQLIRRRLSSGIFFLLVFIFFIFFHLFLLHLREDLSGYIHLLFSLLYLFAWSINLIDAYKGPFFTTAPCAEKCPLNLDIPLYLHFIKNKDFTFSEGIIREKTPFPGTLGRICYKPCEKVCTRIRIDEPVAIQHEKRALFDYSSAEAVKIKVKKRDKSIGIIGAGPAGLTAAYFLAMDGFDVYVYDKEKKPGGMVYHAVPDFRLPRSVVEEELSWIKKTGVKFIQREIGKDITLEELIKKHDALFIAIGLWGEKKLSIKGENKKGIFYGISFLKKAKDGKLPNLGKRVAVIGGGNVAMDAARTAIRKGVYVKVFYRRREKDMPAFSSDYTYAVEEGVKFSFLSYPIEILGGKRIKKVRFAKTELKNENTVIITENVWEEDFDSVIIAVGQVPLTESLKKIGIKTTPDGRIKVDKYFRTSLKKVFAGGDIIRGASTVVQASADGKKAAEIIKLYLQGKPLFFYNLLKFLDFSLEIGKREEITKEKRVKMPRLKKPQRTHTFNEVELGFSKKSAVKEAKRCLKCNAYYTKIR